MKIYILISLFVLLTCALISAFPVEEDDDFPSPQDVELDHPELEEEDLDEAGSYRRYYRGYGYYRRPGYYGYNRRYYKPYYSSYRRRYGYYRRPYYNYYW